MAKHYGKRPIRPRKRKTAASGDGATDALKMRLRAKDDAPLSMLELQQALLEAAKKLKELGPYRAKRTTIYLVDRLRPVVHSHDLLPVRFRPAGSIAPPMSHISQDGHSEFRVG